MKKWQLFKAWFKVLDWHILQVMTKGLSPTRQELILDLSLVRGSHVPYRPRDVTYLSHTIVHSLVEGFQAFMPSLKRL